MADTLDQLHINAGLDRLRADTGPPQLAVYPNSEGFVPINPPAPYIRAYTTIERPIEAAGNSMSGLSTTWTVRWYLHCVGANEYAAAATRMRARAMLLDFRPTIAGRTCGAIRLEASNPPQRDDSTGTPLMDAVDVYRLTTFG